MVFKVIIILFCLINAQLNIQYDGVFIVFRAIINYWSKMQKTKGHELHQFMSMSNNKIMRKYYPINIVE